MRIIKEAGVGFESEVYEALVAAFPGTALHARTEAVGPDGAPCVKWEERDLAAYLARAGSGAWLVVQSTFSLGANPARTLGRLGVAPGHVAAMPTMGKVVPDVLAVLPRPAGHLVLDATGARVPAPGPRQVLTVIDAKHASEPNPSYEAEVVFYSLLLANFLLENGLDGRFAVDAEPLLWTRGSHGRIRLGRPDADPAARISEALGFLDPVNVRVHVQEIRRFLSEKLPSVLAAGDADWRSLDWHVSPNCNTCDFLGHAEWLDADARAKVGECPGHYCMTRAAGDDHLSRVPGMTKGAAKALRQAGVGTVSDLVGLPPDSPAFQGHTLLAKWRRTLPEMAQSIAERCIRRDDARVDGALPPFSDLTVCIGVDQDGGAGLLTGIAFRSTFFRPRGKDEPRPAEPAKPSLAEGFHVVERKTPEAERVAVIGFLRDLAGILSRASSTGEGPGLGGPHAGRATGVTVFWSPGQYDALCQAVGRHLPAVLADDDGAVRAMAWMFPGASLQAGGHDERMPPVVVLRGTATRLLRTPSVHAATLGALVETYRFKDAEPVLPHPFYAEPFTDGVPRERIYEIWAMEDGDAKTFMVYPREGGRQLRDAPRIEKSFTRADFVLMFGRALLTQARGIESLARHLRRDFAGRLTARAPRLSLAAPSWAAGVAADSKLWIARAEFEAAHERVACLSRYLADPDETEASYEGLRLGALVSTEEDGTLVYAVREGSRDAKLKPGDSELTLSFEAVPGFSASAAWQMFPQGGMPAGLKSVSRMRMSSVFAALLVSFDRTALTARVRLAEPRGRNAAAVEAMREAVMAAHGLSLDGGICLLPAMPPDVTVRRLRAVLAEVGNPGIARPDRATCSALGLGEPPAPGDSPVVPMARVLWDAKALEGEAAMPASRVAVAVAAAASVGLDASQARAVETALRRRLTAIWGPPGTGKTKTIQGFLHGLASEAAGSRPARILVTGPTYKAVGEVATRLLKGLSGDPSAPATVALVGAAGREMLSEPVDPPAHVRLLRCQASARDAGFREAMDALDGQGTVVVCAITHQCARIAEQLSDLRDLPSRRMLHRSSTPSSSTRPARSTWRRPPSPSR